MHGRALVLRPLQARSTVARRAHASWPCVMQAHRGADNASSAVRTLEHPADDMHKPLVVQHLHDSKALMLHILFRVCCRTLLHGRCNSCASAQQRHCLAGTPEGHSMYFRAPDHVHCSKAHLQRSKSADGARQVRTRTVSLVLLSTCSGVTNAGAQNSESSSASSVAEA